MELIETISHETHVKPDFIKAILQLHAEGCTIPFMTRYRKEKIGLSNEFVVKQIISRHEELKMLSKKQKEVLQKLTDAGELSEGLKKYIQTATNEYELEELEQSFQPRAKGPQITLTRTALKPLIEIILKQENITVPLEALASNYVNEPSGLVSPDKVIEGLRKILAEELLRTPSLRTDIKNIYWSEALFQCSKTTEKDISSKFSEFDHFAKPAKDITPHQFLTIQTGVRQKQLKFTVTADDQTVLERLFARRISTQEPTIRFLLENVYSELYHEPFKNNLDAYVVKKL
ncbi:MAG TPA: Tex-like N-terminal domain-containing protein, partial [bacterium]|nr:Tex-like N-terminal domain-containing protein [bacterium]